LITEEELDNALFKARNKHGHNKLSEKYIKEEFGF